MSKPVVERFWNWTLSWFLDGEERRNQNRETRLYEDFFSTSILEGASLMEHAYGHGYSTEPRHKKTTRDGLDWYVDNRFDANYGSVWVHHFPNAFTVQVVFLMNYMDKLRLSEEERSTDGIFNLVGFANDTNPNADTVELITVPRAKQALALANEILANRFEEKPLVRAAPFDIKALAEAVGPLGTVDSEQEIEAKDCESCPEVWKRALFDTADATAACGITKIKGDLRQGGSRVWVKPFEFVYVDTGETVEKMSLHVVNSKASTKDALTARSRCFENRTVTFEREFLRQWRLKVNENWIADRKISAAMTCFNLNP